MKICPKCKGICKDTDRECRQCGQIVSAAELVDGDNLLHIRLTDKYELVEYLGEGGMGWIYRGVHLLLESSVAVKIMKPSKSSDEQRSARFKLEARAASRLTHPHIISVIDFGETPSGLLYLVTEFLRGEPLSKLLQDEGILPLKRAMHIMDQILSALEESHNQGVIHRDLKPDNIMVSVLRSGEDFIKVLDFGIAKVNDPESHRLTQQGQLFGTPDYMSPEQIRGTEVTGKADLYSAGAILFEMLTGKVLYPEPNLFDILQNHLFKPPPRLNDAAAGQDYPAMLQQVLDRALAKDPHDRITSADELRQAFRRVSRVQAGKARVCQGCGEAVGLSAQFCPHCGQRVSRQATHTTRQQDLARAETATDLSQILLPQPDTPVSQPTVERLRQSHSVKLPMMDREGELRVVTDLVQGQLSVLQIVGSTGMGKTALARVAAGEAREAGLKVCWVEPHPSQIPVTWAPVQQTLYQVLGLPEQPTLQDLRDSLAGNGTPRSELAGLRELFGLAGGLQDLEPATRKAEILAAAINTVLSTLEPQHLFVFEDLNLFDPCSRAFVDRLTSSCRETPSRVLVTTAIPLLEDMPETVSLELQPLRAHRIEEAVRQMVLRPSETWSGLVRHMIPIAGGNPLWLEQALALAAESGMESEQPLADLAATRLSRLPAEAQQLLQAVAVLGIQAAVQDVAILLGTVPLQGEMVELLVHRGLLASAEEIELANVGQPLEVLQTHPGDRLQILRLSHPLLVQIVRESTPAEVRQQLNSRIVDLFSDRQVPLAILAHHHTEAGNAEEAVGLQEATGDLYREVGDMQQASRHYRKAVELARWQLLLAEDDPRHLTCNIKLGAALREAGDLRGSEVVLRYAEGFSAREGILGIHARYELAKVLAIQGRPVRAASTLRQAIGEAILAGDPDLLARMYLGLADLLVSLGNLQLALQELNEGLDLVTGGQGILSKNGPRQMWMMQLQMAELYLEMEGRQETDLETARDLAQAALDHTGRIFSNTGQARCHLVLARLSHCSGSLHDAQRHHLAALDLLRTMGDRRGQAGCLLEAARSRDAAQSTGFLQQAYQLAREIGWIEGMSQARVENQVF